MKWADCILRYYIYAHFTQLFMVNSSSQTATGTSTAQQPPATDPAKGLSSTEARARLKEYGYNIIQTRQMDEWWKALLRHFRSPLVLLLLIATAISFAVGETINASVISFIVIASVLTDFWQERNAGNAAEKLQQLVKILTIVIRDGVEQPIPSAEICPGDIILLNAGKIVPADATVIMAKDFFVNQSSLTGESFPTEKRAYESAELLGLNPAADCQVFMGSSVLSGTAKAVVTQTGKRTTMGNIAAHLTEQQPLSDFEMGLRRFGWLVMKVSVTLMVFIFGINAWQHQNILQSFMFAIAIAVGLTPELLPMIMSLSMAKGALQMAKKGAIVKRLPSIPNFGSMEILCTDKTGTLTEDRIQLIKCIDITGQYTESVFMAAYLNSYFQTGIKNPLDDAILNFKQPVIKGWTKIDEIPFDFSRKKMSVVVGFGGLKKLICKGAPEEILKSCSNDAAFTSGAMQLYQALSADGFRVIAIGTKDVTAVDHFSKTMEQALDFLGFVAFLDPAKQDAKEVMTALQQIGVEVKIITGDNHLVTQKICHDLALPVKGVMQGADIDLLSDADLEQKVEAITIFARFSPDQKNRIIRALQRKHAVGYMGDGINDAPSLKAADIGISVNSAADVAKASADIILTEKDLLVLKDGILEGRKTFGNTMKYILMGLSSNFGNMFSVAAATLFLPFLPMLPLQILINNFLYDTSQITIPGDNIDDTYIAKPQRWNMKMIYRYMFVFGITSSLFDIITFVLLYRYFSVSMAQFRTGWFIESLSTQILVVFVIRTRHHPFVASRPSTGLVLSTLGCLAIGWLLPFLPFAGALGFETLPWQVTAAIIILVVLYLFTAEMVKRLIYTGSTANGNK
ncbi:MAG TPA: magnesium-translocating P-type ATPase [Chitinophagaceae bacterium]|nr:magnesium-translocating P-type ATPase [Chitinophagaceae bacterium]